MLYASRAHTLPQVSLKLDTPEDRDALQQMRDACSDNAIATRDINGFRKQLLLLSGNGALTALHNGDARVLWVSV